MRILVSRLVLCGRPGVFVLRDLMSGGLRQARLLLGARVDFPQELLDENRELCARAEWTLDKVSKNFLVQAWRTRERLIGGKLRILGGRVVLVPTAPRCTILSGAASGRH